MVTDASQPVLILASQSSRRRELLAEAGYQFTVMPPDEDVECGVCSESGPTGLVAELAYRKAKAVREQILGEEADFGLRHPEGNRDSELTAAFNPQSAIVLAADTVVECDGFVLGKPRDEADARAILTQLSGREHRVLTGVCLWPLNFPFPAVEDSPWRRAGRGETTLPRPMGEGWRESAPLVRVAVTKLRMDQLTGAQLDEYLASGNWEGKAGAFGYQDRLGWVHIVEGSESNVVGLPMEMLAEMFAELDAAKSDQAVRDDG